MSISNFCISQRQKERQKLKKLLATGFVGSFLVHSGVVFALSNIKPRPLEEVEKPIELIVVEAPKPKPEPSPQVKVEAPKPKPEPSPQVKVEAPKPKPEPPRQVKVEAPKPKPEPPPQVKIEAPKPKPEPAKPRPAPVATAPVKSPEPIKPATPPTPLTSVTENPNLDNPIRDNVGGSSKLRAGFSSGSTDPSANGNSPPEGTPEGAGTDVAANSPAPSAPREAIGGIQCVENCEPEYPEALEGAEGDAGIRIVIDEEGNVASASVDRPNSNNRINREALVAAQAMRFAPSEENGSVYAIVKVNFTVAGSEFDRQARERQAQQERERKQQQAARERQEQERRARQAALEKERQAELQQQQQLQPEAKPDLPQQKLPKPLTDINRQERQDEEQLREFRQRIENYQQQQK